MAHGLAVLSLERQCELAASVAGVDVVLLKFAALRRHGFVTVGSRGAQDLDVLVEERNLIRLTQSLTESGLALADKWVPRHHPAVLQASGGVNVEIHTNLPHVRIGMSGQFATLEALRGARLIERAEGAREHLLIASWELLTAHLVAHALVTHAYAPEAYPPLRILSDAIDLDVAHKTELLERVLQWIVADLPKRDIYSLAELAAATAEGRLEEILAGDSGAAVLLRHLLASVLDPAYGRRLRVSRLEQLLREEGPLETTLHFGRAVMRSLGPLVRGRRHL